VDNLNWATGWVLSWGRTVKVLAPPELVERVKEDAEEILKIYTSS
jgi:predicted DNA-binding transcriptional regulator YafY